VEGPAIEGKEEDIKLFEKDCSKCMEAIKDVPANKRRSKYAALYAVAPIQAYKDDFEGDTKLYHTELNKMEKTKDQRDNW